MTSVSEVARHFAALSAERDSVYETRSETEGTGRRVPGGYVTEIVSKSPRDPHGLETTTKRQVFTKADDAEGRRTPILQPMPEFRAPPPVPMAPAASTASTSVQYQESQSRAYSNGSAYDQGDYSRPLPAGGALTRKILSTSPTPDASLGNATAPRPTSMSPSPRPVTSTYDANRTYPQPVPVYTPLKSKIATSNSSASPSTPGSIRSVGFGSITTKVVEPSRLSPMRVEAVYAPVKYVTKRELRKQREATRFGDGAFVRLRSSSVPRLDEARLSAGREFVASEPYRGSPKRRSTGRDSANRVVESEAEYLFRTQAPVRGSIPPVSQQRSDPYDDYYTQPRVVGGGGGGGGGYQGSEAGDDDDTSSLTSAGAYWQHNRGTRREGGGSRQRGESNPRGGPARAPNYDVVEYESQYDPPQPRGQTQPYFAQGGNYRASSRSSVASSSDSRITPTRRVQRSIRPVDSISLRGVGKMLAEICGSSSFPGIPSYGEEAFCLVNRGTYLIKYGNAGPHERFVAVRLFQDEKTRTVGPYFSWQNHAEAVAVKEKFHLAHLASVSAGTHSQNFRKYMLTNNTIQGPHVGDKKRELPTTYAFTLLFQSQTHARSVDLLALDDQTYRCWMIVMEYIIAVNSAQGSRRGQSDIESLAGESVAPSSAA